MTGTVVLTAGRACVITPCEVCGAAMIQTIDDQVDRVAQHYRWHSQRASSGSAASSSRADEGDAAAS